MGHEGSVERNVSRLGVWAGLTAALLIGCGGGGGGGGGAGETVTSFAYVANVDDNNQPLGNGSIRNQYLPSVRQWGLDASLFKTVTFKERYNVRLNADFFNVLNHPNFGAPNANVSSATFGQIRSARDPRIMQASMKLIF